MATPSVLGKRSFGDDAAAADARETRRRRVSRRAARTDALAIFEDDDRCEDVIVVAETRPTAAAAKRQSPRKHAGCDAAVLPVVLIEADENLKPHAGSLENVTFPRTPKTPRHRDALATKETPRHRVQVAARLPLTPQTPKTPSAVPTLYNSARQLFARSSRPDQLVGRESEVAQLRSFIEGGIASRSGRCLYISGPPGTGKSAFVNRVLEEVGNVPGVQSTYVNCMSIKSAKEICVKLVEDLGPANQTVKDPLECLKALLFPRQSSKDLYIVTLDEIDHLLTLDHEILYSLFEWSLNPASRLVLVGIANALDLTDRFLPRLKSRNLRPQLLPFVPYTVPQIVSVVTTRLKALSSDPAHVPFVHPTAIQFCAKKVASQTGDLRKAFDLVRRLIDIVENEVRAKQVMQQDPASSPLAENPNLSSPAATPLKRKLSQDPLAHLTPETAPRATVAHAARVAAAAFNNGTSQRLKTLNLQQKAALCALLALEKRKAAALRAREFQTPSKEARSPPTVRKLHELYGQLCRREGKLAPLERGEFLDVVSSLEGLGLIREAETLKAKAAAKGLGGKEERHIVSAVSEKEVEGSLEGVVGDLLRGLLAEE